MNTEKENETHMNLVAAALYDRKAAFYSTPHFFENIAVAKRSASEILNNPNSQVHHHPQDYDLVYVGLYNKSKGELIPVEKDTLLNFGTLRDQLEILEEQRLASLSHLQEVPPPHTDDDIPPTSVAN